MKGNVSPELFASRISSHGEVTDLANGFRLKSKIPFSIFVVQKSTTTEVEILYASDAIGLLVNCKCYQDDEASPIPILNNSWTEAAIIELMPDAIDLDMYRVFWGAGTDVEES